MFRKSTIAAFAILAVVGAASPVFALDAHSQALNGGGSIGYNSTNVLTGTAENSAQADAIGLDAFAMVPRERAHVRSGLRAFDMVLAASGDTPAATGGGSTGYNSYVGRDS